MRNLVPSPSAALPTLPPPGIDRAVRYLTNKLEPVAGGYELPASEAPNSQQRAGLEQRLSRLAGWLAPFGVDQLQAVRDELSALLGTRKGSVTAADAAVLLEVYVQDLRDLPLHAIQAACRDFRQGRVPDDEGFRPPQETIRAQVQRHLHDLARERQRIEAVLGARLVEGRPPPAEQRKASAVAVRQSLGIPAGGLSSASAHRVPADAPDALGAIAAEVQAKTDARMARHRKAQREVVEGLDDRFVTGDAA